MGAGFQEPLKDFSDGLEVLRAYHRVMLGLCEDLRGLARHLEDGRPLDEIRPQARALLDFFSVATRYHHQDEEQALFPMLMAQSVMLRGMIDKLEEDHREMEAVWGFLAPRLREPSAIDDRALFIQGCTRFAQLLQWHIEREDENFFPRVEEILGAEPRREMGRRMAELRLSGEAGVSKDG